ncbi:hypothetical protein I4F81_009194 [Pyropia yezoensis]|uniref:Uncharacterized protein n=1 Tax=Pyropia yezoensis TaxID=2788 RepID=A0ACC3C9C9_PYRYE|nr:hypothetical protein I4F81_009194 [Neopyropia yezoensis]
MPRHEDGFNAEKAATFLSQQSSTDLRVALSALGVKGKMQANNTAKRTAVLDVMKRNNLSDDALEAMMDDEATAISRARQLISSSEGIPSPGRDPPFSANDVARLFHVVADPHHYDGLRWANQPLSRMELDKEQTSLWVTTLGPKFNDSAYRPAKPKLLGAIMEADLRGLDPNRHVGPRDPSKLETHYRAMRSAYTVALSNYNQSGHNEPVFNDYINGDHRLLYIHCLLQGNWALDFVLRTIPAAAQSELGLSGSSDVGASGRGKRKRAKTAEVSIQGLDGLASALSGLAESGAGTTGSSAADIFDNAEAIGAVTKQLGAARLALDASPSDECIRAVVKHLQGQLSKFVR